MFISSYNTYIQTNTTDKTSRIKDTKETQAKNNFASEFLKNPTLQKVQTTSTPINYQKNYKIFNNKQKLAQNIESKQGIINANKFNFTSSLTNAKIAYTANANMFSIVAKPKPSLSQTQDIKKDDSSSIYKKISAINTYISNDKYYQITA